MPDIDDTNAAPKSPIPSQPSRPSTSPSPPANTSHSLPQTSALAWDMSQAMKLAGGPGLDKVIADADAAMPMEGLPVASERAGGTGRRAGLKRKAGEITRSAAEDFALLTTRMTWYRLFRRCDPPKDEEDIKELNELADWYLNIPKFCF